MNRGMLLQSETAIPVAQDPSAIHAIEYSRTAALLRRRALQTHRTEDERAELRRRADWYEQRAIVKREGGIMPPELRTPLESLELVDALRRRLAEVVNIAQHLSLEELAAFQLAIDADTNDRRLARSTQSIAVGVEQWMQLAGELLGPLGVRQNTESGEYLFLPFVMHTAVAR